MATPPRRSSSPSSTRHLDPELLVTVIDPVAGAAGARSHQHGGATVFHAARQQRPRSLCPRTDDRTRQCRCVGGDRVCRAGVHQRSRGRSMPTPRLRSGTHALPRPKRSREHDVAPALAQVQTLREAQASILIERGNVALARWDTATATVAFERAAGLAPGSKDAAQGLREAAKVGKPGYLFRDALGEARGPELVVVGRVALGRHEVSVGEFRRYWNAAGKEKSAPRHRPAAIASRSSVPRANACGTIPGFQHRATIRWVCVKNHAMAEVMSRGWGQGSGKRYRLPTATELTQAGVGLARDSRGPAPATCSMPISAANSGGVPGWSAATATPDCAWWALLLRKRPVYMILGAMCGNGPAVAMQAIAASDRPSAQAGFPTPTTSRSAFSRPTLPSTPSVCAWRARSTDVSPNPRSA